MMRVSKYHLALKKHSFGFHHQGNCWNFKFYRMKFNGSTHYGFWRFFIIRDTTA